MKHTNKLLYCFLLLGILCAGCGGDKETTAASMTKTYVSHGLAFSAKVKNVTMLSKYDGEVRIVGVDPQWVIELDVKDPPKDAPEFKDISGLVAFAVHSPTKIFMGDADDAKGKSFTFILTATRNQDGKIKYESLRVAS